MQYKTIQFPVMSEIVISKSVFITNLIPVTDEDNALEFLSKIRSDHKNATHNCYAYIITKNGIERRSDDGEPQGTAGVPIYNVLEKASLSHILCICTRYFGGILLGTGGLIRAYGGSASTALQKAEILIVEDMANVNIEIPYKFYEKVKIIISKYHTTVIDESFGTSVSLAITVQNKELNLLKSEIIECTFGESKIL